MCLKDFAKGGHANRLIRKIIWPFIDKNFVIRLAVNFDNPVSQLLVLISSIKIYR